MKVTGIEEVYVTNVYRDHNSREDQRLFHHRYKIYQDDGEIYNDGFDLDEEI